MQARHTQRNPFSSSRAARLPGCLALALLGACSMGAPAAVTGPDEAASCRRLADPEPGSADPPLPSSLYGELRQDGAILPVTLDGIGGSYSGETRPIDRCDASGSYAVDRLVLVDSRGGPVATALRQSNADYVVLYRSGQSVRVGRATFPRGAASYSAMMGGPPTLKSLTVSGSGRQGDTLTVSFQAQAAPDDCGVKEGQFWLTSSPGGPVLGGVQLTIPGEGGTGALRVPPDAPLATVWIEGRIITRTGTQATLRRPGNFVGGYTLIDASGRGTMTAVPVTALTVQANPQADKVPPQVMAFTAKPAALARCQEVSLALQLSDDQGLPASQSAWVQLGPESLPGLLRLKLSGSDGLLTGTFRVPQDAPTGPWVASTLPVSDAAGNVQMAMQSATFRVEAPGQPAPSSDLPAQLAGIEVLPQAAVVGQPLRLTVTWTGTGLK